MIPRAFRSLSICRLLARRLTLLFLQAPCSAVELALVRQKDGIAAGCSHRPKRNNGIEGIHRWIFKGLQILNIFKGLQILNIDEPYFKYFPGDAYNGTQSCRLEAATPSYCFAGVFAPPCAGGCPSCYMLW
jgi:hypothetical protein